MYEFLHDYIKPKYQNNAKLCYMDTDSCIINIKANIYMRILLMILKQDLINHIMKPTDHYQNERIKK